MRCLLVAELATAHSGDVALAADMIRAAAYAGDATKLRSFHLYDWKDGAFVHVRGPLS